MEITPKPQTVDLSFDNVNERGTSELVELTEFQTTTQLARGRSPESLFYYKTLPFVDQTPKDILTRPYTIKSDTFSGAGLQFFNPLDLWLQQADVARAMAYFSYLKFKIVVRHQITAAFELYGYVLAGYYYGPVTNYAFEDIFSTDCYIASVSAVEPIEYEIAYNSPSSYISSRNLGSVDNYCRCFIRWDVAHSVGGANEIQMKTIVTMENLEVGGYTGIRVNSGKNSNPVLNMYQGVSKALDYAIPLASAAANVYSNAISSNPGGVPVGIQSFQAETCGTAAGASVSQSLYGDLTKPSYSMQKQTLDIVPHTRPGFNGAIDHNLSDLMTLPGYLNMATVDSEGLIISLRLGNMIDIDKSWLFYIRNAFRFWVGSMKICLWFFASPLVAARFKVSVSYGNMPNQVSATADDYSVPTKQFLVRGDHREELIIPYHSWLPCFENSGDNVIDPPFFGLFELYCIQKPNEVAAGAQGEIKIVATVSGCSDNVVYSTRHFFYPNYGSPPSSSNNNTKKISFSTKKAKPLVVQASVRQVHRSSEGYNFGLEVPINYPDYMVPVTKVSEIIGRYDDRLASDSSFQNIVLPTNTTSDGIRIIDPNVSNLDYISAAFAFRRGSMEFKLGYSPLSSGEPYTFSNTLDPSVVTVPSTTDTRTANGQFVGNTSIWTVADVNVPYLSTYHQQLIPTTANFNIQPGTTAPIGSLERVLVRAGPDYQLSHPNILPLVRDRV